MRYAAGVGGAAVLLALILQADPVVMLETLRSAGWGLSYLVPYRILFFALYALGWLLLLRPYDPNRRAGFGYVFWATTVREGIDRLLPVASVGGGIVGIRLIQFRGLPTSGVIATVVIETVSTLMAVYLFTAAGLLLWGQLDVDASRRHHILLLFWLTIPLPLALVLLLRFGSLFGRLYAVIRTLVGHFNGLSDGAAYLDVELRALFGRKRLLATVCLLDCAALASGSFEIWLTLHLFGHPVTSIEAFVLESMMQAARHLAFFVPAGVGVQEGGLVVFGQFLGISSELALAVSMAKRMRELLWGIPALVSWHYVEARHLQKRMSNAH